MTFKVGDIVRLVNDDGMNAVKGSRARVVKEGYTNVHIGSHKNLIRVEWIRPLALRRYDTMVAEGQMDGGYYEDLFVLDEPQDAPYVESEDFLDFVERLTDLIKEAKKYNVKVSAKYEG